MPNTRQRDREKYSAALRAWYATFKNARLYSPSHPSTTEAAQKFLQALQDVLSIRFDFLLHHVDGLFVIDDMLFIEESLSLYDLLRGFEERKIAKVAFLPNVTTKEVVDLSQHLMEKSGPSRGFQSEHIKATLEEERKHDDKSKTVRAHFDRSVTIYNEWLVLAEKTLTKIIEEQAVSLADLALPLDRLVDAVHQRPMDFSLMLATFPRTNLSVQHAVHTTIQCVYLAHQLGCDLTSTKILALSALLHDTGRFLLPSEFSSGHKLKEGDIEFVRLHARDGASFLAGVQGLPMSVVRVALEHHVGADGQGYPALPGSLKPHIFSQIVGLCDFVSWATVSDHHYHRPVPMHRILRTTLHRARTQFPQLLVKLLLPFHGLYAPGTIVQLNTGERGVVIMPNLAHIARPMVLVKTTQGTWNPRNLAALGNNSTDPFPLSIRKTLGHMDKIDSLIDFLPDVESAAA